MVFRIQEAAYAFIRDELAKTPSGVIRVDNIVAHLSDLYPDLPSSVIAERVAEIVIAQGGQLAAHPSSRHNN